MGGSKGARSANVGERDLTEMVRQKKKPRQLGEEEDPKRGFSGRR